MQTDEVEDLTTSDKAEEKSTSTQPWEPDLSNKIAQTLAGASNLATCMGQRFNSRQATASRVLFEDPLADDETNARAQAVDPSSSNSHHVSDSARTPGAFTGESAI